MLRLEGKRAIVTGAGRGIGKAIAQKFVNEGARVLVCDIVADRIETAASDLSSGGEVHALAGDVTSPAFCDDVINRAQEMFDGVDILVNNAGIAYYEPFAEHSETSWDRTLEVNLKAVFLLSQRAAKLMIDQGTTGVILSTASNNGHVAEKGFAAYNAAKAGVVLLTKTMAIELAPFNIRANCVSPGHIGPTGLSQEAGVEKGFFDVASEHIPLGRMGTLEEVANLFSFLASDEASFITGESVIIDGGQTSEQY